VSGAKAQEIELLQLAFVLGRNHEAFPFQRINLILGSDEIFRIDFQSHRLAGSVPDNQGILFDKDRDLPQDIGKHRTIMGLSLCRSHGPQGNAQLFNTYWEVIFSKRSYQ
jgi:hypothetical protein